MARWKALPGGLDPAVVEFVGELRRAKDGSGLSLRRLAARTGYSASSWERYLGGRLLPPREAVEALAGVAEVAGEEQARLLARYEMAADAWQRDQPEGSAQQGQDATTGHGPLDRVADTPDQAVPALAVTDRHGREARLQLLVTAVVSAAVGATVATLVVLAVRSPTVINTTSTTAVVRQPVAYACNYVRTAGLWYAGNSTTRTDPLEVDMSGTAVAELQCLLRRAGISPGGIDGNFGPLTEAAVIKAQKTFGLGVDGQVGPQTWAALRG
ncbi:helix-turn-helix protein [Streptomyces sp. 846.5]|nr:peptidoglycan-binding protein [Streptomyces sp. 846.5]TDT98394.1 helix-turn-helix protein [Streptomyces sp. 846.5]